MTRLLLLLCGMLLGVSAVAQTTGPASTTSTTSASRASRASQANLSLQVITDQGQQLLQATLTAQGKPVENATIEFRVPRHFGVLPLGKDQTLDDGTAAIPFPADLPGGRTGEIQVIAVVQAPADLAGITTQQVFGGAKALQDTPGDFPRALWAPRAPWLLIVSFVTILVAVWCSYAYVVRQLWALPKGR